MGVLYCMEVVFRYFLNAPTRWSLEFITFLMLIVTFLAIPHAVRGGMHIAVTLLADLYPRYAEPHPVRHERRSAPMLCAFIAYISLHRERRAVPGLDRDHRQHPDPEMVAVGLHHLRLRQFGALVSAAAVHTAASRSSRCCRSCRGPARGPRGRHEPARILALGLAAKIGLFLSGLAVYLCFILLVGSAVIFLFGPAGFGMIANSMFAVTTTEALTTVPLYVLMGEILLRSGSIDALFAADRQAGRRRPRPAVPHGADLSAILGAPAGSGIAVAAMLGRSVMRPMIARGYDPQLTAGVMMGGALLAPIIPPSVLAIIIGTIADVSIADLLISGIIPGIVLTGFYIAHRDLEGVAQPGARAGRGLRAAVARARSSIALARMIPFSLIIFVSVGLIMVDFATASEAAALGVLAALIESFCYRKMGWRDYLQAAGESAVLSAVILIIIATAILLGQVLAFTGIVQELGNAIAGIEGEPLAAVLLPDAAAVHPLHLRRPDRDHDDPDPDLRSADQDAGLRSGVVLDAVPDHHGGGRDHAAVRLHHLRAEGGGARDIADRALSAGLAVHRRDARGRRAVHGVSRDCHLSAADDEMIRCASGALHSSTAIALISIRYSGEVILVISTMVEAGAGGLKYSRRTLWIFSKCSMLRQ